MKSYILSKNLKFVDVKKYGFAVEPRYYFYGWEKFPAIMGRESAVKALIEAKKFLPRGFNFKIWDCKRARNVQFLMQKSFERRLKLAYPKFGASKIKKLVEKFGGPTPPPLVPKRLDGHGSGGAFDLTIIDAKGNELYFGTDHDDLTKKAATDFFEKKKKLSVFDKEARKNRRLLIMAMKKADFKNYAPEWWHWGYGK